MEICLVLNSNVVFVKTMSLASDFLPQIDASRCITCELCIKICPNDALTLINKLPEIVSPDACDYTTACQEICPTGAISLTYEIVPSNE
jgi:pyruvate formate lyase activating enzyme